MSDYYKVHKSLLLSMEMKDVTPEKLAGMIGIEPGDFISMLNTNEPLNPEIKEAIAKALEEPAVDIFDNEICEACMTGKDVKRVLKEAEPLQPGACITKADLYEFFRMDILIDEACINCEIRKGIKKDV